MNLKTAFPLLFFGFLLMLIPSRAMAQTGSVGQADLRKKSQEVVEFVNTNRLKEAQKASLEALDIAKRLFGDDHNETGICYSNAGQVFMARKKLNEAVEYLSEALRIFKLMPEADPDRLVATYQKLATAMAFDGRDKAADVLLNEAEKFAADEFGAESEVTLGVLRTHAYFYVLTKDYIKADEAFARLYVLTGKNHGFDSPQASGLVDDYACKVAVDAQNDLPEGGRTKFRIAIRVSAPVRPDGKGVPDVRVVNGKAIRLPKPGYPSRAAVRGLKGRVVVRVIIDELGNVVEAKAVCGPAVFWRACEEAARKATFEPTTLGGTPVEISGYVYYEFR